MKTIAIIAGILAGLNIADAQWKPDATIVGSLSGQFFVSARSATPSAHTLELAMETNMVTLEPALLAVSCERIKQELWRELDTRDQWQGKIFVVLRPARSTNDLIRIAPEKLGDNWDCRVELPDTVDRSRFVEAIVRACLLEMANRHATSRSAEIPEWLAQGFTRQLMGSSEDRLILPPPDTIENGMSVKRVKVDLTDNPKTTGPNTRRMNPLAEAIETVHANPPLSFEELSWPTEEQLSGDEANVYQSSAQLFVSQLLRTKDGPASVRQLLAKLPAYLNWQLAFLDAFHDTFQQPLDIEKWWALELVQFAGRDLSHLWTPEESWRQMDSLFHFPIEVQIGEAPPMRTDITFQTIIRGWSRTQQLQMIKKKLWELDMLRLHVSQDYVPLVDEYRQVLQEYYKKRGASARMLRQSGPIPDKMIEEAVEQLDALDAHRADLRPRPSVPLASAAETTPGVAR